MATESDLRDLLRDPDPEGRPTIDLNAVVTRARRRRRPKVIAAQALGSVAAVGALFVGISAIIPPQQAAMMVAEDSAGGAEEFASCLVEWAGALGASALADAGAGMTQRLRNSNPRDTARRILKNPARHAVHARPHHQPRRR